MLYDLAKPKSTSYKARIYKPFITPQYRFLYVLITSLPLWLSLCLFLSLPHPSLFPALTQVKVKQKKNNV